jgi:hypothetical protein
MPPEQPNCLVALRMDLQNGPVISGVRVFAKGKNKTATVSWYTSATEPPPGYESVLDGLVFVKSSTIEPIVGMQRFEVTKIESDYQWNDMPIPKV